MPTRKAELMVRSLLAVSALTVFGLLPAGALARQAATGPAMARPLALHRAAVTVDIAVSRRTTGCHAWAPIFRPTLASLAIGKILVALPTYLPPLATGVRAVATVLMPPLVYTVTLTTSPNRPNAGLVLRIRGNAGNHLASLGATRLVMVNGKHLRLQTHPHGLVKVGWFAGAHGITYTVAAPRSMPRPTLLRIAGFLLPAPLHGAIGSNTTPTKPACP